MFLHPVRWCSMSLSQSFDLRRHALTPQTRSFQLLKQHNPTVDEKNVSCILLFSRCIYASFSYLIKEDRSMHMKGNQKKVNSPFCLLVIHQRIVGSRKSESPQGRPNVGLPLPCVGLVCGLPLLSPAGVSVDFMG